MKRYSSLALFLGIFLGLGVLTAAESPSLTELADKYESDKGSTRHHYTEIYEKFLLPIKKTSTKIFEIGILEGASLRMWRDYFPNATIYGIDIKDCSFLDSDKIKTFIADQSNRDNLRGFIEKYHGDFDFILDDGGHTMEQQQISFGYLFPFVRKGGYYIIEDLHTSFMPTEKYGADPARKNTTFFMVANYIRSGKIQSLYMTEDEKNYLQENIEYGTISSRNSGRSIMCIFKKK